MHAYIWILSCQSSIYLACLKNIVITVRAVYFSRIPCTNLLYLSFIWWTLALYQKYWDENFLAGLLSKEGDAFVDGAVIAAARTLPTWSDGDLPPVPSIERKAVKELQEECQKMLAKFPTTSKKDLKILGKLLKLIMDASHQLDSSATFLLCKIS